MVLLKTLLMFCASVIASAIFLTVSIGAFFVVVLSTFFIFVFFSIVFIFRKIFELAFPVDKDGESE